MAAIRGYDIEVLLLDRPQRPRRRRSRRRRLALLLLLLENITGLGFGRRPTNAGQLGFQHRCHLFPRKMPNMAKRRCLSQEAPDGYPAESGASKVRL
jgi:hypothetical protein